MYLVCLEILHEENYFLFLLYLDSYCVKFWGHLNAEVSCCPLLENPSRVQFIVICASTMRYRCNENQGKEAKLALQGEGRCVRLSRCWCSGGRVLAAIWGLIRSGSAFRGWACRLDMACSGEGDHQQHCLVRPSCTFCVHVSHVHCYHYLSFRSMVLHPKIS